MIVPTIAERQMRILGVVAVARAAFSRFAQFASAGRDVGSPSY
jgi:hypothetical protein